MNSRLAAMPKKATLKRRLDRARQALYALRIEPQNSAHFIALRQRRAYAPARLYTGAADLSNTTRPIATRTITRSSEPHTSIDDLSNLPQLRVRNICHS